MLKKTLHCLSALATCLALAGCCANDTCVCNDLLADALFFSFQIGGTGGFSATDVDTLLVTRITLPDPKTNGKTSRETKLLTFPLTSNGLSLKRDSLIINNAAPFASAGSTTKLDAYTYRIMAVRTDQVAGRKVQTRYLFKVNNIQLAGAYKADGCCTCYENSGKRFDVNLTASDTLTVVPRIVEAPVDKPIVTVLKKTP